MFTLVGHLTHRLRPIIMILLVDSFYQHPYHVFGPGHFALDLIEVQIQLAGVRDAHSPSSLRQYQGAGQLMVFWLLYLWRRANLEVPIRVNFLVIDRWRPGVPNLWHLLTSHNWTCLVRA